MKDKYVYGRTSVYKMHYHIVWCVKYRKPVLTEEVSSFLKEVLVDIGKEAGFSVSACEVGENDHVHVFIDANPQISVTTIMKHLKGTSALRLRKKFPDITKTLYKGVLWNKSYFVETIGSTSESHVKEYVLRQKDHQA